MDRPKLMVYCGIYLSYILRLMWPYMSLLSSSIYIVAHVVIADSRVNSYTSCSSLHPFINAHLLIPTLSHVAKWESCDNIYTYCGLCGHTPTRVGHMGSTIWAVRMQRYDMAFRCHTYCGPFCHIQYAHVYINTHCGSCDHLSGLCDHIPTRVGQMSSTTWNTWMRWYGI